MPTVGQRQQRVPGCRWFYKDQVEIDEIVDFAVNGGHVYHWQVGKVGCIGRATAAAVQGNAQPADQRGE